MKPPIVALLLSFSAIFLAPPTISAQTTTFSNSTPIIINDGDAATPYPSDILVSGLGPVEKVTVTLSGLNHTFPDDIDILLVGPQGQNLIIFSDVGGGPDLSGMSYIITLDDAAPLNVPDTGTLVSGTFKPTNIGAGDPFGPPAPAPSTATTLSVFNGTDPNGTWSLFVLDDAAQDDGSISGGWSLSITAVPEPSTAILFGAGFVALGVWHCLRRR